MEKEQYGGSLLLELRNLAIPFSLLLAKNGVEYVMKKRKSQEKEEPKPKQFTGKSKPKLMSRKTMEKSVKEFKGGMIKFLEAHK
jgi:hypothetical protein